MPTPDSLLVPLHGQRGQVLLGVVILFTVIVVTVVVGLAGPILSQVHMTNNLQQSKQSYYTAESLAEDLAYRFRTGKQVSASETLSMGNTEATANVTTEGGQQHIRADGDLNDLIRSVYIILSQGSGIAFNYGTQTGNGGFIMSNNAGVNGNVYSNGNITGSNGSFVIGTAVAASSVAQSADQVNDTPLPPSDSITFGNANGTQDLAQRFQISVDAPANNVSVYIRKVGSPSNATVRITSDNGGSPAATSLTSATLSAAQVTSSYGWVTVVLPTGVSLLSDATYWIVIDASTNSSNYYVLAANTNYTNGQAKIGRYGNTWSDTFPVGLDGYFRFYIGGQTSTISGLTVGQVDIGDAWAHTVTGSTIAGTNYCQNGSGNNKECDTSKADPGPQPYPVSEGNIAEWKAAAAGGTVYAGDKTISTPTSMGPAEITGDLTVNATLTLTGVVYVHGTISISNNQQVIIDSSF
ncbi:MAG TPA: choice-of-anchor R domain-containing protein, partial [Candidatus Paceibacterota bacterium]